MKEPPKNLSKVGTIRTSQAACVGMTMSLDGHEDLERACLHEMNTVPGTLSGKVVEVDEAGNLITDIPVQSLENAPQDASLRIVVDEHETYGLYPVDHSQPSMTLVAIKQENGPLKIVLVDDSASAMLGVQVGAAVGVHW